MSIFATPPLGAEEGWGFPEENTEVKKGSAAYSRSPSKQKRTVLIWMWVQVTPCQLRLVLYHIRLSGSLAASGISTLPLGDHVMCSVYACYLPPRACCSPHSSHELLLLCDQAWPISTFHPHPRPQRLGQNGALDCNLASDFAGTGRLSPAPGEECGQHRGRGPRQERHHHPGPMSKPFLDEPGLAGHLACHFPLLLVPARAEFHLLQWSGP